MTTIDASGRAGRQSWFPRDERVTADHQQRAREETKVHLRHAGRECVQAGEQLLEEYVFIHLDNPGDKLNTLLQASVTAYCRALLSIAMLSARRNSSCMLGCAAVACAGREQSGGWPTCSLPATVCRCWASCTLWWTSNAARTTRMP